MARTQSKIILAIMVTVAVAAVGYVFRDPLAHMATRFVAFYFPCTRPITYTIGAFDTRFGISKEKFFATIAEAEHVWEQPIGRQLFTYHQDGDLKINLVYDARQDATIALQKLGITVHDDRASYDAIKTKYVALKAAYLRDKPRIDAQVAVFEEHQRAYETEVAYSNSRGGAPADEYQRLQDEKDALDQELATLRDAQASFNANVNNLNAVVVVLNRLTKTLNLAVAEFNGIGAARGDEFEEGVYTNDSGGTEINIYQFDDQKKLVRVLAHELGHALGLEHVDDPKAIMYRLNQGANEKLTATDVAALKQWCRIF